MITKETKNYSAVNNSSSDQNKEPNLLGFLANIAITWNDILSWKAGRFTAFLMCDKCKEVVSFNGTARLPVQREKNYAISIGVCLRPEYFSPALPIIKICEDLPSEIANELSASFSLFFLNSSSSGNKVRSSVELILDNLNISRFKIGENGEVINNKSGYPIENSLHTRIIEFSKKHDHLGDILLAIKILGNEASHSNNLSKEDLIEAYGVIDYLIDELYVRPKKYKKALLSSSGIKDKYSK